MGIRKAICLNNLEVACRQQVVKDDYYLPKCRTVPLYALCPGCQRAGECGGCHIDIINNGQMVAGSRTAEQRLCAVCALLLIFPPANIDIQTLTASARWQWRICLWGYNRWIKKFINFDKLKFPEFTSFCNLVRAIQTGHYIIWTYHVWFGEKLCLFTNFWNGKPFIYTIWSSRKDRQWLSVWRGEYLAEYSYNL